MRTQQVINPRETRNSLGGEFAEWMRRSPALGLGLATILMAAGPAQAAPPVAQTQNVSTNENQTVNITLTGSDADGDSLRFGITDQPDRGSLSFNFISGCTKLQAFNYNPNADNDDGSCRYTSCRQIKLADPNATTGNYTIDPDGTGSFGALTVHCDMTTDGGGYTMLNVDSGINTFRSTDHNSCRAMGLNMVVPRTKEHWRSLLNRYGTSYFNTIPGISKPSSGGNYTGFAMRSGSVPDWRALDGGSWFIRDSPYSEPNGDYEANCWLLMYNFDVNNIQFNDGTCSYSTSRYICSTNDKAGVENLGGVASCATIKLNDPNAASGNYTITTSTGARVTAFCDMTTDGGGYTMVPVDSGIRTSRSTDNDSCKAMGLNMVVPRTKEHWRSLLNRFGTSYFNTIPGISKPGGGGNYTGFAMRSGSVPDWRALDGGSWFMRDSPYSEPNGDYDGNCWLLMYNFDVNNIQFNDGGCSYSTTRYICSTNDKDGPLVRDTGLRTCQEILRANPSAPSGNYTLRPKQGVTVSAYCDMSTDGGGYTAVAIDDGIRTFRSTDNDSCKALGLDMVIPRTKAHFNSLLSRFGTSYFGTVPGISKPTNGGNYTNFTMNSKAGIIDWRATDNGQWWLRDTPYSEPNGDYTANCWLSMYHFDINDLRYNDGNCSYSTTRYICSSNDKKGFEQISAQRRTCATIKQGDPNAVSGNYTITTSTGAQVTAFCDMTTDGGGYTMVPVDSGINTFRSTDNDSCKAMGLNMVVPRTKEHWRSMLNRFGQSYFNTIPGISKPGGGGNYTSFAMRSGSVPDWRALDGGSWFMRDTPYSEPNGDYDGNCWLLQYDWNVDNIRFNDGGCSYSTSRYICSTNDKDGPLRPPVSFRSCAEIKRATPNAATGNYTIVTETGRAVTAYCDMTTDGGGYTMVPVDSGIRTSRVSDMDSCREMGLQMIVPRTRAHWVSMLGRFGQSYFNTIPGISKPFDGGNYTGFAMKSGSVPDWRAIDGGSWFMRNSPYSEPNGDYSQNCWLLQYHWDVDNIQYNDGGCSYSTARYLCSTNDKDGDITLPKSCMAIKLLNPNAASGNYDINPGRGRLTVHCDMTTDGGGYTMLNIDSGITTSRITDRDTCKDLGMQMVVPRTKEHWRSLLSRYGTSYFNTIPAIAKPHSGGNYTGFAMKFGSVPDWQAIDLGSWFMRDSPFGEPNGDYTENCWLLQYNWDVNNIQFNDANCAYSTSRYICSTNDKDPDPNFQRFQNQTRPPARTSISGTYTPANGYFGTDFFDFRVTDPGGETSTARVNITVISVNVAPVAQNQSVSVAEDGTLNITLVATDGDGDSLTYTLLTNPGQGTLTGTAPNLTYRPAANFNGSDSLTFRVNDGTVNSNTATVSITVTPVNDTPVANAQSVTTNEDTPVTITLTGSDIDGNTLTYSLVSNPTRGAISCTGAVCTYTPTANLNGADSFIFRVNDGTVFSANATVSVTVNAVNDTPVANNGTAVVNEDSSVGIVLTGSDVDGNTLTYTVVTNPTRGTLSGTVPNLTYTPTANLNGADSFTFRVNDGTVNSANATVSITINPVNDVPVANVQSVTTNEDTSRSITLTGSDIDGNTLTYSLVSNPSQGALSCTGPACTYTPNLNYNGADSFIFRVHDGTVFSANATVSITVTSVNDAPVANAANVSTNEDTSVAIVLTATDADGNALTFTVTTQPLRGTLTGTAPNLVYRPNTNFNGADSLSFKVNDGTIDSAIVNVSITVNPVNDAPVADTRALQTNEDTPLTLTLTGSDVDTGTTLTFATLTTPSNGTLTCTGAACTYRPAANFNGDDSFLFRVNDGALNSAPAAITITVNAVNDQPVAATQNVTTNEDTARNIVLTGTDVDGNPLTFEVMSNPTRGALSGTAPNLTYTPTANANGADSFAFRVNDGTVNSTIAVVNITITPVNDAPVAQPRNLSTDENIAVSLTLTATDVDGDALTFSVTRDPANGRLSGVAPNLTYTPNNGFLGVDTFNFRAFDGGLDNEATVTVTVRNPGLEPPALTIDTASLWFGAGQTLQARMTDGRCQTPPTVAVTPTSITLAVTNLQNGGWQLTSPVLPQGTYNASITVTSRCSDRTTVATRVFGVDTTRPDIVYGELPQNGVNPNDITTWPIKSLLEELPINSLLRDPLSGVASASTTLFALDRNNQSFALHSGNFTTRTGAPPTGLTVTTASLCSNVQHCNNGRLRLEPLEGDRFMLRIQLTDVAGNVRVSDFLFRVARLRPSIVAWREALVALTSNNTQANNARLAAIAKLDIALEGFDNNYIGNMVLTLEDAEALSRVARAFDTRVDTRPQALLVANLTHRFFVEELKIVENEFGLLGPVQTADTHLDLARGHIDIEASGDALLSCANAYFYMEMPRMPEIVENFGTTRSLINQIIGEMDTYITHNPVLAGRTQVAVARTELSIVRDFIVRVVTNGDTSLSDLEHLRLLLGLANVAQQIKVVEEAGVWVRNWQWGLTQIVHLYADRGLRNTRSRLGLFSPMLTEGENQLARAVVHRGRQEADDYMTLLINSRCVMIGLYNLVFEPNEAIPTACCADMLRYRGIDSRVPICQ